MGYQALLFCPDEKLARVVSQVFSELDFAVEPVHEPFAAVKKLMAQRYDAVVVDCENEQNASLLFKSARNSSFNQNSLAIALVEGQAGVAKAYRIGANLVLTKPINVEQAKGTLRVARGLLRKNSDAASATATSAAPAPTPAKAAPVSVPSSLPSPGRSATTITTPPSRTELPEFEAPLPASEIPAPPPAMAASAKVEDKPAVVSLSEAQTQRPATLVEAQLSAFPVAAKSDAVNDDAILKGKNEPAKIAVRAAPVHNTSVAFKSVAGSAAATAPAKEATAPPAKESKTVELEPAKRSQTSAPEAAAVAATMFESAGASSAPSFAALGDEDSEGSAGRKKILIAAVAILALAALGYFGYEKFGKSNATTAPVPPPVTTPQNSGEPAPTLAPMSAPLEVPAKSTLDRASAASPASGAKTTGAAALDKPSAIAANPPVIRIGTNPEAETKQSSATPIVVKSGTGRAKTQAQAEESAPALPGTVVSANDNKLSGLISAAPNLPKPTLATLRISQGVSQGLVIKRVQPKYPQAALAVHAQGAVQIEATITKEGIVTNLKVLSGDPVLARAALEAVRQWRYKPYYLDGDPVEIQTQITINFKAN
ncbi:MAG: TonB family protein [Acidobacteriia bacterium]|nr:TonB family protein [Terriglobia bacterium]